MDDALWCHIALLECIKQNNYISVINCEMILAKQPQ